MMPILARESTIRMSKVIFVSGEDLGIGDMMGSNPRSGLEIVSTEHAGRINVLLLMCGQYDGSRNLRSETDCLRKAALEAEIRRWSCL